MKHSRGLLAVAALLSGITVTNALAAGHGGHGGTFGAGHIGHGHGAEALKGAGPFLGNSFVAPPPVINSSSPYTVPQAPETPVSPASPGSIFGSG